MNIRLLYITAKDKKQALHIGEYLLEEKLVACMLRLQQLGLTFGYRSRVEFWSKYLLQRYENSNKKHIRSNRHYEEKSNR